jgi:hypothetical protein
MRTVGGLEFQRAAGVPRVEDHRPVDRPAEGSERLRDRAMRMGRQRDDGSVDAANRDRQAAGDRRGLGEPLPEHAFESYAADGLERSEGFGGAIPENDVVTAAQQLDDGGGAPRAGSEDRYFHRGGRLARNIDPASLFLSRDVITVDAAVKRSGMNLDRHEITVSITRIAGPRESHAIHLPESQYRANAEAWTRPG